VRKDGYDQDGDNFKGKPRSNDTHASGTDDDARQIKTLCLLNEMHTQTSIIKECNFEGPYAIENYSCIVRSTIGSYFGMNWHSFISDSDISRFCTIGSRVSIGAFNHPTDWLSVHEFQFRKDLNQFGSLTAALERNTINVIRTRTKIGPDVWIGDNSVVISGVNIGTGAIIGAGSVVTKDLLPYGIYVGNPSRLLRFRFSSEVIGRLLEAKWWEFSIEELNGVKFDQIDTALDQIEGLRVRLGK